MCAKPPILIGRPVKWLETFQSYGVTVLRVWCQWDSGRGFVDASPTSTLYEPDGALRAGPLATLKAMLGDADRVGLGVESTQSGL
jgi:hypothetical protein